MSRAKQPKPSHSSEAVDCPVAAIAEQAARIQHAIKVLEDGPLGGADAETTSRKLDILHARLGVLEAQAVYLEARSGMGALFQCGLLLAETGSWQEEKSEAITDHLVYSLRAFITATTGAKIDAAIEDYYLGESYNPHRVFDEALAESASDEKAA